MGMADGETDMDEDRNEDEEETTDKKQRKKRTRCDEQDDRKTHTCSGGGPFRWTSERGLVRRVNGGCSTLRGHMCCG